MKNNFLVSVVVICCCLSSAAFASDLCNVSTEADSGNYSLRGLLDGDTGSECNLVTDDTHPDQTVGVTNLLYFTTPEICTQPESCNAGIVRVIKPATPIAITSVNNIFVGNFSPDMVNSTELSYTESNYYVGETSTVPEYGFVVIDGAKLDAATSPFSCADTANSVYLRNMLVIGTDLTKDILFSGCVKDGGAVRICNGTFVEAAGISDIGFDPDTDTSWCSSTPDSGQQHDWQGLITPIQFQCKDSDGDGYYAMTFSGLRPSQQGSDTASVPCSTISSDKRGDCDDSDGAINDAATETCDDIDNNCDGAVDEDDVCAQQPCPPTPI